MKEPKRFGVIKGGLPKNAEDEHHRIYCTRCKKNRGVENGAFMELRTGGYYRRGRMVGFNKVLVCAFCFTKDGHMEIMGHMR